MSVENSLSNEVKLPIKFRQPSESTPAKIMIVHISKMESFICSLNPAGSLYQDVTDEQDIRKCFTDLEKYLQTKNIKLITVEDALSLDNDSLMKLAEESLNYERETDIIEEKKKLNESSDSSSNPSPDKRKKSLDEYELNSSDKYKKEVLHKFKKHNLMNVILTRPKITLKFIDTDTYIETSSITFCPLGNLVFCRDQQITTKKGVVIGRSRTNQRKYEHIIMKQVFKNLKVEPVGEVLDGYLEGGDFFVARENLSMLGIGLRTNMVAANYLMENDLLDTRYMALCYDENDRDQQRMHLNTYFNILNDNNVVVIDFDEVREKVQKEENIDRRVYFFDKDKDAKEIESDKLNIKNKIGEYKLIKIYDSFYKFLDDMKFNYIKITHQEQKEYMINFLNIGNNTVISVNKNLEKKVKNLGINVQYFDCQPILNMYGGMHCMTQVSRA